MKSSIFFAVFIIQSLTKSIALIWVIKWVITVSTLFFWVIHVLFTRDGAAMVKQEHHVKQTDWIIAEVYCVWWSHDSYLASRGGSTTRLCSHAAADWAQFPAWLLLQISLLSTCTTWRYLHVRRRSSRWQVYPAWGYAFYLLNPVMVSTPYLGFLWGCDIAGCVIKREPECVCNKMAV